MNRVSRLGCLFFLVIGLAPAVAFAQASITGVVRDTSGAVLPGVTVEASSPALIEKVRAVTTDGKFHKLNVRVKRSGLQVRSRPGYMAMSATEVERALAPKKAGPPPAITEALGTIAVSAQQRRHLIRSWVGMSPFISTVKSISRSAWKCRRAFPVTLR